MDYIISEYEMGKYKEKLHMLQTDCDELEVSLKASNQALKESEEKLAKVEHTLYVERSTASLILQKLSEVNRQLLQCSNTPAPTRISFNELA
mgnify:CR=1 FL=1|jgi:chromosome segregation ATPase